MKRHTWFLPIVVVAACLPCLGLPVGAGLLASGAFGGSLAFLGAPWALPLASGALLAVALAFVRLRRNASSCDSAG